MDPLILLIIGISVAGLFTLVLYLVSSLFLRSTTLLATQDDMKFKQQLFQCGEAISPCEGRYFTSEFHWISFFSVLRVSIFIIATIIAVSASILADNAIIAFLYIGIAFFSSLLLTVDLTQGTSTEDRD